MEMVTEPDFRSVEEVQAYALKLRAILRYLGVNSGDMEKGVIRFEANISIRPAGSKEFGTRTEVKNLNSFRALVRATEYELARQQKIVEGGGTIDQATLGWDEARNITLMQRSKEQAHDYRYFPEPDLPPLVIDPKWVAEIKAALPELPDAKRDRFARDYSLDLNEAELLLAERSVAEYFEAAVKLSGGQKAKSVFNWLTGELFRYMNEAAISIEEVKVTPKMLVELIDLVEAGTINLNTGKRVLGDMFKSGESATSIVAAKGLAQISDNSAIESIVQKVLAANAAEVEKYLGGKENVLGFLVGQIMKESKGKANPNAVQEILKKQLDMKRE
ncbi:MAG TPA: Asp-tRNA(Asn)/Glu-tRNA(Gln) amidotransferase subunit GatB, partial [Anaerolineae bacterium]|nr:Asp-tRNA(Asn)/Glu-tRNA(Gln) amidotransferase subunit GatB [Anaerolineae bacterium]